MKYNFFKANVHLFVCCSSCRPWHIIPTMCSPAEFPLFIKSAGSKWTFLNWRVEVTTAAICSSYLYLSAADEVVVSFNRRTQYGSSWQGLAVLTPTCLPTPSCCSHGMRPSPHQQVAVLLFSRPHDRHVIPHTHSTATRTQRQGLHFWAEHFFFWADF